MGSSTVRICAQWTGRRRPPARVDVALPTMMRTATPSRIVGTIARPTRARLPRWVSAGADLTTPTRTATGPRIAAISALITLSEHYRACVGAMARTARPRTAPRSSQCPTRQRPPCPPPSPSARPPLPPAPSLWARTPPSLGRSPCPARAPPAPPGARRSCRSPPPVKWTTGPPRVGRSRMGATTMWTLPALLLWWAWTARL
mmetsp:Transcript_49497/g.108096  ORF Transcript_49497/g.108096 Transcript_49497/m.108096 type:complete len:202 (+) Transcript_49497:1333-1938(+)